MSPLARALIAFGAGGFAGWIGETLANDTPRFSHFFDDQKVPFLPIYGFGAAAIALAAPVLHQKQTPWYVRGALYAGGLSAIELLGCGIDRAQGEASWDYGKSLTTTAAGCLSLKHALLWGALGLAVDGLVSI